jgi:hypothetical protein
VNTKNIEFYDEIYRRTCFLYDVSTINERLYCLVNKIDKLLICLYCENKLKFKNFITGYIHTCNNKQCKNKYIVEQKYKVGEDGLTVHQRTSIASAKTMNKKVNGVSLRDKAEIKRQKVVKSIDLQTGLSFEKLMGRSVSKAMNRVQENGKTVAQNISVKTANTMKNTILANGLNLYQNRLFNYENSIKNEKSPIKKYANTNIFFQGSFEKTFLDSLMKIDLLNEISKPKFIVYFDDINNRFRRYFADFLLLNFVVEIKSNWTYDKNGTDMCERRINNLKWYTTVKNCKKRFIVIFDNKFVREFFIDDFINLDKNIYEKDKCMLFNESNLKMLFKQTTLCDICAINNSVLL